MDDELYERDILSWSEQQAQLLRRMARGEQLNEAVDWENVIDELEDVGRAQVLACESHLFQAIVHLLKLRAAPTGRVTSRKEELLNDLREARKHFTPSMRQRISLKDEFDAALRYVAAYYPKWADEEQVFHSLASCPYMLDDLLADPPDIAALLAKLR